VAHGCKILARLLIAHGSAYTTKFALKSGGFTIMGNRLKRFWDVQTIWPICLSILFGYDVGEIDFGRDFELASLVDIFGKRKIVYPESLQIITSMLQHGFKDVMRHQEDPESPVKHLAPGNLSSAQPSALNGRPRAKSMELAEAIETRCKSLSCQST
jgi:beige protein homolog 1